MQRRVILWGAAGHARVLRDAGIDVLALFDRDAVDPPWPGAMVHRGRAGFAVWRAGWQGPLPGFLVAIGGARGLDRIEIATWLAAQGLAEATLVHGGALVEPSAVLEPGAQVLIGAVVGAGARIGRQTILNTRASVDHDTVVGPGCHIAPGAVVCGEVRIGTGVLIGAGAVIGPKIIIGDGAVIGAGSVVLRDVAPGRKVWGTPARVQD